MLTVYLWHMTPVVVVAVALYPTGLLPQPAIGSAGWWALRPAWIAALALILAGRHLAGQVRAAAAPPADTAASRPGGAAARGQQHSRFAARRHGRFAARPHLPLAGPRRSGRAGCRRRWRRRCGVARIAILGFAPGGDVPAGTLAAYGCGVILTLAAGRLAPRMTVAERPV